MPGPYKYGRLPADPSKPRVVLRERSGITLSPPTSVDWYSAVPAGSWGMLGNGPDDTVAPGYPGCGDCTCAGAGHMIDQVAWYAQGNTPAPINSNEVISMYSAITGYDPNTGQNDTGAVIQDVLGWWQRNGLGGYAVTGFAQIDASNIALVQQCIAYFGAVYAGLEVPQSAQQQFDANQPWSVVRGSPIEGGHLVPLMGYDPSHFYCSTWGAIQPLTYDFYQQYFVSQQDVWVAILPQWMESVGETPSKLDTAQANADFSS